MQNDQRVQDVMEGEKAIVTWSDTADAALGRMRGLGCDRLAVIDPYGVIGICERSVLMAYQQRGSWLGSISVADLMRRGPFWCREDDPLSKVLLSMERLKTDILAVLDKRGRVVGTVSRQQLEAVRNAQEHAQTDARH
ncbi:CBS domain-containing protein [Benzoatithermus flavus]|uniref:CBS domain-containing protein n=1 Tax=Benzoatithermus flavus TaxID=3108223 RepID=A0ABU8XXK5_9PROT